LANRSRSCRRLTFRRRSLPSSSTQVIPSTTSTTPLVWRDDDLRSSLRRSLDLRLLTPLEYDITLARPASGAYTAAA